MQEQGGFALSLSDLDILNVLAQEEFLSTFTGEMTFENKQIMVLDRCQITTLQ